MFLALQVAFLFKTGSHRYITIAVFPLPLMAVSELGSWGYTITLMTSRSQIGGLRVNTITDLVLNPWKVEWRMNVSITESVEINKWTHIAYQCCSKNSMEGFIRDFLWKSATLWSTARVFSFLSPALQPHHFMASLLEVDYSVFLWNI